MICKDCQDAGKMLAAGVSLVAVQQAHMRCPAYGFQGDGEVARGGRSRCDCQHETQSLGGKSSGRA